MSTANGPETTKRYGVVGMCFGAVFVCYIDRVNISIAAIAMQSEFGWTDTTKGLVLSSFFVGYMLTMAVAGWLADRFGGKLVLGLSVIWWSVFTMLTPWAAYAAFAMLIVARIGLGLGEAATFPASYGLFSRWVPVNERARSIALLSSGISIGTLFALTTTGWIVVNFGWPAVFYWFGAVGLVWAVAWFLFIHDDPSIHPSISKAELERIGVRAGEPREKIRFPWRAFVKLPAFWALLVNHFCSNVLLYVALAWLPSYFRDTQGLSLTGAGLYSAAPWLSMFLLTNVGGWIGDYFCGGHERHRGAQDHADGGACRRAIFLLLLRRCESANTRRSADVGGPWHRLLRGGGFRDEPPDIAPKYAGVLLGITNTVGNHPGCRRRCADGLAGRDNRILRLGIPDGRLREPGWRGRLAAVREGRKTG